MISKKKKKKKKVFAKIQSDFSPKFRKFKRLRGGSFRMGGAIFHFSQKIGLKSTKYMRFCILHKPMGGLEPPPPPPPWLRYWLDISLINIKNRKKLNDLVYLHWRSRREFNSTTNSKQTHKNYCHYYCKKTFSIINLNNFLMVQNFKIALKKAVFHS